jgi:hypothetical protein
MVISSDKNNWFWEKDLHWIKNPAQVSFGLQIQKSERARFKMKKRVKSDDRLELSTICRQLKMEARNPNQISFGLEIRFR